MMGDAMTSLKRCRVLLRLARRNDLSVYLRALSHFDRERPRASAMNVDDGAPLFVDHAVPIGGDRGVGPFEEPGGVVSSEIDATMAAHLAEVIVPVGAVEGVAFVEILHERHVTQV